MADKDDLNSSLADQQNNIIRFSPSLDINTLPNMIPANFSAEQI